MPLSITAYKKKNATNWGYHLNHNIHISKEGGFDYYFIVVGPLHMHEVRRLAWCRQTLHVEREEASREDDDLAELTPVTFELVPVVIVPEDECLGPLLRSVGVFVVLARVVCDLVPVRSVPYVDRVDAIPHVSQVPNNSLLYRNPRVVLKLNSRHLHLNPLTDATQNNA